MPPLDVLHYFTSFRSLGGVESVLRLHLAADSDHGLRSRLVVYFEGAQPPVERVSFMDLDATLSLRAARQRARCAIGPQPVDVAVQHMPWGCAHFGDLDAARRRIVLLHSDIPGVGPALARCNGWIDGVLAVSDALMERTRESLPDLAADRLALVPYPVCPPESPIPVRPPPRGRPFVLGYSGRLVSLQKRVERFPALAQALLAAGVDFRLEFLGDGPALAELQAALPDRNRYRFHGRQQGEDYWRILRQWDALTFVSDFEGTPIAQLEAMSQGVLPVFPGLKCGGDEYAAAVAPELVYPAGDFTRAAAVVKWLAELEPAAWHGLREAARRQVAPHTPRSYLEQFAGFVRHIHAAPPRPRSPWPRRPFPLDLVTLSMLQRFGAWKRRLRG